MTETLYRSKTPDLQAWAQQYFELALGEETVDDQLGYFVRETQCWFDPVKKETIRTQYTLSPRGGFATLDEAQNRYDAQKMFRARRGYLHCYAPRYEFAKKVRYTRVEIPVEPKSARNEEKPA